MDLPVLEIERVAHVGAMDLTLKTQGSYEGAGLSVSLHPSSWASIARLGEDGYILERPGARFIDRLALTKLQIADIVQWGRDEGLVSDGETWKVSYYDAEDEARRSFTVGSREAAEAEAEILERPRITGPMRTPMATPELLSRSMHGRTDASPDLVFDLTLVALAESLGYDGVWWRERHDPARLSAPRGVIVPGMVEDWSASPADRLQLEAFQDDPSPSRGPRP